MKVKKIIKKLGEIQEVRIFSNDGYLLESKMAIGLLKQYPSNPYIFKLLNAKIVFIKPTRLTDIIVVDIYTDLENKNFNGSKEK